MFQTKYFFFATFFVFNSLLPVAFSQPFDPKEYRPIESLIQERLTQANIPVLLQLSLKVNLPALLDEKDEFGLYLKTCLNDVEGQIYCHLEKLSVISQVYHSNRIPILNALGFNPSFPESRPVLSRSDQSRIRALTQDRHFLSFLTFEVQIKEPSLFRFLEKDRMPTLYTVKKSAFAIQNEKVQGRITPSDFHANIYNLKGLDLGQVTFEF